MYKDFVTVYSQKSGKHTCLCSEITQVHELAICTLLYYSLLSEVHSIMEHMLKAPLYHKGVQ